MMLVGVSPKSRKAFGTNEHQRVESSTFSIRKNLHPVLGDIKRRSNTETMGHAAPHFFGIVNNTARYILHT